MEVENPTKMNARQTQIIKDHLALVFEKETPNRDSKITVDEFTKKWKKNHPDIPANHREATRRGYTPPTVFC